MKISVIIPTYKPNYYIWECLNSLKLQTLSKNLFEVLIILNGDKEPYYEQISNWIDKNKIKNMKLLYSEKKGVSDARNLGLEESMGDYICFIDDDDYISENYLKNFYCTLDERSLFIANLQNFYENEKNIPLLEKKYKKSDVTTNILKYRKEFSYIGAKIIPKRIIENVRFDPKYKNGEDSLFMLKISKNIEQIKTKDANSIYWRRIRKNSSNFKKKRISYILKNLFNLLNEYLSIFFKKEYNKKFVFIEILALLKGGIYSILNNIKK